MKELKSKSVSFSTDLESDKNAEITALTNVNNDYKIARQFRILASWVSLDLKDEATRGAQHPVSIGAGVPR